MDRGAPEPAISSDTLDSWKAIAAHLSRDVRTVMRWERVRGLPVHRVPGGGKPGVYALKSELDAWRKSTRLHLVEQAERPAPQPLTPSIAVLPFANLSADKKNEYFSDGLTDGIITDLARISGLRVTARTSSFSFRGKGQDVRDIGLTLGVSTVLEGSVQRSGRRVRVSAQLVNASDGFHLWSERFDRELADVFAIQDEISSAIAAALEVRLVPTPSSRRTTNPEAYRLWLKGRYYHRYESMEVIAGCRGCYEEAIALDPSFPQPYLGLAELYRGLSDYGIVRPKDVGAQGWAAVQKALELDDSLGEAYALSGTYRAWMDFDWKGAEADFRRASVLNPAAVEAHWLRAMMCLLPLNRLEEAAHEMERAIELDPLSPLVHSYFAWLLAFKRESGRALEEIETALALDPEYAPAFAIRGSVLYYADRVEEGAASWQAAVQKMERAAVAIGALGYGLALLGRKAEAQAILAELDAAESTSYVSPVSRAWVYIGLGDFDAAFEWLDRAVDDGDPHILHFPSKPAYDPMRQDPRFSALLRRMRLA
jgi:adenylate cyclase